MLYSTFFILSTILNGRITTTFIISNLTLIVFSLIY